MKKVLSLILSVVLIISIMSVGMFGITANAATSGTTGDCTWSLNGTVLTISGYGRMADYTYSSQAPWSYNGITKVVIRDGVTTIGDYAFYYHTNLTTISIPNSVTSIGNSAFMDCNSLTSVVIPDSVTYIGDNAFCNDFNITSVTIPDDVTYIGSYAFAYTSIQSIVIPKNVTVIADSTFMSCKSLTSVTMHDGIVSIGDDAFSFNNFSKIIIPDSVTYIGECAFMWNESLSAVTIGANVKTISNNAFRGCSSLRSVYYRGSQTEKSNISIYSYNTDLTNATWYYNSCIGSKNHTYTNDCDDECNVCAFTREAHNFTNDCDKDCNICGFIRVPSDHIYDNTCDRACNVCGEERKITHTYSNDSDKNCDICGQIRGPYTITYYLDGGTNAAKNPDMYAEEDTITLKDASKVGYDFAGWFLDANKTEQITEIYMMGNLELYAKFLPKSYNATFDSNGAEISDQITITLHTGITSTKKTVLVNNGDSFSPYDYWQPEFSGYVFAGWMHNSKLISNQIEITEDIDLYAKWVENPNGYPVLGEDCTSISAYREEKYCFISCNYTRIYYTLSAQKRYAEVLSPTTHLVQYRYSASSYSSISAAGLSVSLPGYTSLKDGSWTDYGYATLEPGTLVQISNRQSGDLGYFGSLAGKAAVETTEKTAYNGITVSDKRTKSQEYDSVINAPSVSKTGYKFLGWYDSNGNQITDTWKYTEDQTFTAKWQPTKYYITYNLNGGTNNSSNPSSYTIEDSITLTKPTKPGYTFNGWYSDANFTTKVTSISKRTGNITLYAKWEANSYNLTLDANNGAFAPQVTFVSDGKEIKSARLFETDSITAYRPDDKEGYVFAGWYNDDAFTSLFKFNGTIKNDITLYAKWIECDSNTINPEASKNYNVTIQGKTEQLYAFVPVADGQITVTSESNDLDLYGILYDGSKNVLISADDISSTDLDFSYTYDVKAGQLYYISVKGTTALTSGTAELSINWTGDCTISGTTYQNRQISVVYDINYKLPQKPVREGYVFLGWYDENDTKITDGKWNFTADKTLTAKWSTATYHTVTFKNLSGEIISSESYYLSEDIVAPALPTKAPDKTYTYIAKWNNNYTGVCTGDAVYSPIFEAKYIDYTVTFKNWDGEVISTKTYHYGDKITAPSTPTKAADNTYTYTFAGWDKTVGNCTEDTTYTATYTPTYINYTVVFKNWNGDILSSKNYHWGDSVTAPATPTKADDDLHTYTFAGWDKEVVNCAGNTTYTATYTKLRKDGLRYVIMTNTSISVPDDGSEIYYTIEISDYVGNDSVVTIPATIEGLPVTVIRSTAFENCTTLTSIILPDSVKSVENGAFDGCTNLKTVFYGGSNKPGIGTSNTNLSDAKWHYDITTTTFNGKDVYRCGKCNLLYYPNGSNVPLQKLSLISLPNNVRYRTGDSLDLTGLSIQGVYANGLTVSLDSTVVETVTTDLSKPGKKTVSLTVAGASVDFEIYVHDVVQDITVNPSLYPQSAHNYANNAIQTKTFTYPGAQSLVITFDSRTNVESGYDYIYIFDGAGNQIAKYTGANAANKTLTITGDTFKVKLTSDNSGTYYGYAFSSIIAIMEHSGEFIHVPVTDPATVTCTQAGLTEGSHCEICGDILVAQEEIDALGHSYDAAFDWSEDHTACTATLTCTRSCGEVQTIDCTITVSEPNTQQTKHTATAEYNGQVFTDILTCGNFLVSFVDWDGTEINSAYYHKGDEVIIPANPVRTADNTYTYEFAGWDKAVVNCNGNATYTAIYTRYYIDYTVTFKNWDGTILSTKTYHYGDTVVAPTNPTKPADNTYTYEFAGWNKAVVNCSGNATYTATYNPVYINYTVIFKNWNGTVLSTKTYHYGDKVTAPSNPTKPADNTYTYKFTGWDKAVVNCSGNATYTATYDSTYIDYTVTFKDWDGTVLSTKTYHYGNQVTAPINPTRDADNKCTYTFAGWDKAVVNCSGNATYTATYDSTYIDYTVTFKDWDGTVLSTKTYHYGDKVIAPSNPTKPADNTYTYKFTDWDKTVVNCSGNATYTATYTPSYIDYTVVFINWNGDVISTNTYHYGEAVEIPAAPTRENDNYYAYTFVGWDNEVSACFGNAEYTATFIANHYHTYSDWIIDTPADANTEGAQYKECTECGEVLETEVIPQLKPETPTLTKIANAASGVKVTWDAVDGTDSYIVYRKAYNASTKKWSGWAKLATGVTSNSCVDKTVKTGAYYRYTVRAENEAGLSGYDANGIKTYFLATPKVTSTANASNAITVKWGKVAGATGYIVYRKTTGGWTNLGKTKGTTFTDKIAKAGVTYRYTVRAYYGSYLSSYNANGSAVRRLLTPTLKSVSSAKAGVTLKWNKVTGATGYIVYRKTGNGGWQKIATVTGNSKVSYLDKTAKKGTTYTYTVKAYYGTSTSAYNTKGLTIKDK